MTLWGAFESPNGTAQAFTDADARYGTPLQLARSFWNLDADFTRIRAIGRVPILSFAAKHWRYPDLTVADVAAGQVDGILDGIGSNLASVNPGYATFAHEPDMAVDKGEYDIATWMAAYQRFFQAVKLHASQWRVGPIFTGWFARDHYLDWQFSGHLNFVGFDPYCWPASWVEPFTMLDREVPQLLARWPHKPLLICETACPEDPRKPDWLRALPAAVASYPHIKGVAMFDVLKEHDWRLDSSPASLTAAREMAVAFGAMP